MTRVSRRSNTAHQSTAFCEEPLYQQFAGVDAADIDVTFELVDDQSGEVLETGSYREWMERQEG